MPWNISSVVQARQRFIESVFDLGFSVAAACRKAGISCKTGFKFLKRFRQSGRPGLKDKSRRPKASPAQMAKHWQKRIRAVRSKRPYWGGKKIHAYLKRKYPRQKLPRPRTIQRWLGLGNLVKKHPGKSLPGPVVPYAGLTAAGYPNHVWTIDFKGWVRTADGQRQEPLTVRDLFSRYGLRIKLLANQEDALVRPVLQALFLKRGVPGIIRVDNGCPFAGTGALGLSRLSVWWLRLGIRVELTRKARPGDNASHEQFHGCYQREVLNQNKAADRKTLQKQSDQWLKLYNQERPNDALQGQTPAQLYRPSRRKFAGQPSALTYRAGWERRHVRNRGHIKWQGRLRYIGRAFVGQRIGLQRTRNQYGIWNVYLDKLLIGQLYDKDKMGLRAAKYRRSTSSKP